MKLCPVTTLRQQGDGKVLVPQECFHWAQGILAGINNTLASEGKSSLPGLR